MATKKEVTAVTPNSLTFKVGNLNYNLRTANTTQRFVKTQIKSIMLRNNLDKDTLITLPSGRKVTYREINNTKEFIRLLFPEVYVIPRNEEGFERLHEVMDIIASTAGKIKVSWNDIGNSKISYGEELFKNVITDLVTTEVITQEEADDFVTMIDTYKHFYNY